MVNYVEINLNKPETMRKKFYNIVTKSKLIFIKLKFLIVIINLDIYEDKNLWSSINYNTSFFKEIENLFNIIHNETYNNGFD
jgi:hypothetical protein